MNVLRLALATALSSIVLPYAASQTAAPTLAASALTAVPPLVPYSGQVEGRTGQAAATFLIYKDQTGGEPLFTESQIVSFDAAGRYKIQLGAANPNGLPSDLFATGEARLAHRSDLVARVSTWTRLLEREASRTCAATARSAGPWRL